MLKELKTIIGCLIATAFLVGAAVTVSAAGPTVDHRFFIQLPDGKEESIKGAKIHKYYQGNVGEHEAPYLVGSYCKYDGFGETLQREISDGYDCATNESCSLKDYGAPYLPKSFNTSSSVYEYSDASYYAFNNRSFSDFLKEKAPYLATIYDSNNIRGFSGAKWQGTVEYDAQSSEGGGVSFPSDLSNADYNSAPEWGQIPGYEGKQSWEPGEVYLNTIGGNILQSRIKWVLKTPSQQLATGNLKGACGPQTWNGPLSYNVTLSNFDLKNQQFLFSDVYLGMYYDEQTAKIHNFLGKSTYERDGTQLKNGDWFGYQIKRFTSLPANNTLSLTWDSSIKLGSNQKTIDDLVTFLASDANLPKEFEVAANLSVGSGGKQTAFTPNIGSFKPSITKNACATPPTESPMCMSVELLNAEGTKITNFASLKEGNGVFVRCGQINDDNIKYKSRVVELDSSGKVVKETPLLNGSFDRVHSQPFTIPNQGRFAVQCAICPNGVCQEYEPLPGATSVRDK